MKLKELRNNKKKIKELLELERWSIRCERVKEIINRSYWTGEEKVSIVKSSDYHYASRRTRKKGQEIIDIGADKYGQYTYYIYLVIE